MSTRKRTRLSVPNSGADGHYMRQTPSRSHYLSANWPTERAEKALAIESNRLYEEGGRVAPGCAPQRDLRARWEFR